MNSAALLQLVASTPITIDPIDVDHLNKCQEKYRELEGEWLDDPVAFDVTYQLTVYLLEEARFVKAIQRQGATGIGAELLHFQRMFIWKLAVKAVDKAERDTPFSNDPNN
jgi:hypothetical protein